MFEPADEAWLGAVVQKAETVEEVKLAVSIFLVERRNKRRMARQRLELPTSGYTSTMYRSSSFADVLAVTSKKIEPN